MRAFLSAVVALAVIAFGSEYALNALDWTTAEQNAAPNAVRLPGHSQEE